MVMLNVENDPEVPKAEYPFQVSRYEANLPGNYGSPYIRVWCRILSGAFQGVEATLQLSQRISPRTNLYAFLRVLGVAIPEQIGAQANLDHMIGKCFLGTNVPNKTDRGTYNNVDSNPESWKQWSAAASVPMPPPQPVAVAAVAAPVAVAPATPPPAVTAPTGPLPNF